VFTVVERFTFGWWNVSAVLVEASVIEPLDPFQVAISMSSMPLHKPLEIKAGERVRLTMRKQTMIVHPMHLHGHTFAVAPSAGPGIGKDTVNVAPMHTLSVDLQADNPGQWMAQRLSLRVGNDDGPVGCCLRPVRIRRSGPSGGVVGLPGGDLSL
jgi:hypothetical protein